MQVNIILEPFLSMPQKRFSSTIIDLSSLFRGMQVFDPRVFNRVELDAKVQALEVVFKEFENQDQSFAVFVEHLIDSPVWQSWDYAGNPFKSYCLDLASAVDHWNQEMIEEPAYHSRKHFQDVCLSLTILLMQDLTDPNLKNIDLQWSINPVERWILLFCAIGHDFGHDGSTNRVPFELEKVSIKIIRHFLLDQDCSPELMRDLMPMVEAIILATDPNSYSNLWIKFESSKNQHERIDLMSVLMIESDLLASILPYRGKQLSERLGQEWQGHHPEMARAVSTPKGRLIFLSKLKLLSKQVKILGLSNILDLVKRDLTITIEKS